ncbi:hypothetical protein WJX72_008759 [[Myrmecia] bisecta]|uniref:Rieske domain-containing protein n=1 Tax=[Myrmecia] bisecta TaxID=41462 RepID=A0AAW1PM32_9CHLO
MPCKTAGTCLLKDQYHLVATRPPFQASGQSPDSEKAHARELSKSTAHTQRPGQSLLGALPCQNNAVPLREGARPLSAKCDQQGSFAWAKQWYPVAFVDDMDPHAAFPTKLLGRELVLWRVAGGHWRCADDQWASPLSRPAFYPTQRFMRDMPVAYDVMLENLSDQSHVPFAHHGVANRRDNPWANHYKIRNVNAGCACQDGFTFDLEWSPDGQQPPVLTKVSCEPPAYLEFFTPSADGFKVLYFYLTPLDEHSTRVFTQSVTTQPLLPRHLLRVAALRPRWIDHLVLNEVVDGDLAYLYQTCRNVVPDGRPGGSWRRQYYLPTQADRSVLAWRHWYHGRGRNGPFAQSAASSTAAEPLLRTELLDRYTQHTQHCPSCLKMLRRLRRMRRLLLGTAAAIFLTASVELAQTGLHHQTGRLALHLTLGLVSLALARQAHVWEANFTFKDYVHANR